MVDRRRAGAPRTVSGSVSPPSKSRAHPPQRRGHPPHRPRVDRLASPMNVAVDARHPGDRADQQPRRGPAIAAVDRPLRRAPWPARDPPAPGADRARPSARTPAARRPSPARPRSRSKPGDRPSPLPPSRRGSAPGASSSCRRRSAPRPPAARSRRAVSIAPPRRRSARPGRQSAAGRTGSRPSGSTPSAPTHSTAAPVVTSRWSPAGTTPSLRQMAKNASVSATMSATRRCLRPPARRVLPCIGSSIHAAASPSRRAARSSGGRPRSTASAPSRAISSSRPGSRAGSSASASRSSSSAAKRRPALHPDHIGDPRGEGDMRAVRPGGCARRSTACGPTRPTSARRRRGSQRFLVRQHQRLMAGEQPAAGFAANGRWSPPNGDRPRRAALDRAPARLPRTQAG